MLLRLQNIKTGSWFGIAEDARITRLVIGWPWTDDVVPGHATAMIRYPALAVADWLIPSAFWKPVIFWGSRFTPRSGLGESESGHRTVERICSLVSSLA